MKKIGLIFFSGIFLLTGYLGAAAKTRVLPIDEFIRLGAQNDTEFEEILINQLFLKYEKKLRLPPGDLVVGLKQDYNFYLTQDRDDPDTEISLSKLFPKAGTEISAGYEVRSTILSGVNPSAYNISIAQPIAENAFGKSTRLLDQIVGLEVDVAQFQIVEAYEDYLATILIAYYDWVEAYENLKVGEKSYQQNLKLLENIKQRKKSQIALPIDVNKISLQVTDKKENVIALRETLQNRLNVIRRIIRYEGDEPLVPTDPEPLASLDLPFEQEFNNFWEKSRTYRILRLLENKSDLQVDRSANELLPSIDLLFDYLVEGEDPEVRDREEKVTAGIELEWPIPDQVTRAELEVSKIQRDKSRLTTTNVSYQLYQDTKNLSEQIKREKKLTEIADEKIRLSNDIVKDETENYSYGRVTLNDFIQAVNLQDESRFNKIIRGLRYKKLLVEWLRITDQLITKNQIDARHSTPENE